ncbi:metal transporter CNNM3-like [Anguilla rostrata]|uniref:metal transporter CNNM3-like n=1 Tax=Anguilla rostrata TaxID=7938 RepID=UPI0030D3DC8C
MMQPVYETLITPPTPSQVTRLQYLNAVMASRVAQSPDPPEIKVLPNSQTKLLNERNTNPGASKSMEPVAGGETHG